MDYSERSTSTGLTVAARAAGTAEAMTAAARMTAAEAIKEISAWQLRIRDVPGDHAREDKTDAHAYSYSDSGHHQALAQNIGENDARISAQCHANAELAGAATHGKGEHTGYAHHGNQKRHAGESAEHNYVQTVGG